MTGKILIYVSLLFSVLSIIFYAFSRKNPNLFKILGSSAYFGMMAAFVGASIYLLSNILAHNFSFTYIWQYSSRELSDGLLIASFYSGQQGSFMLWALILSIIGMILIPYSRKHGYESVMIPIFTLTISFILIMLIFKSPFEYVWETYAEENITKGFMPGNGRGLNPVLQNYWITIHPPILFTGYSMMAVPFVFALTGLIKNDFHKWVKRALPWTLFGTAILGFGIMLGGFWAYETLGWGGFWGWDPVENSSLIPWLISVALVHTMLIQRNTGSLIKTNFVLAILSFVFVLYATFLTRSGVLGDTSVHSFVEPGRTIYIMLVLFMGIFVLGGATVLIWKWKQINKATPKREIKSKSKEFSISMGSIFILALTVIILMGTSWPAIADVFGREKAAVDISFYNQWGLVLAIFILIVNGISVYQRWKSKTMKQALQSIIVSLGFASVATAIFVYIGVREYKFMALTLVAFFALFSNLEYIIKHLFKNPSSSGAFISHLGLAILILGVVATGGYSVSRDITLNNGESTEALGYKLTFIGKEEIEKELTDREKYKFHIKVEKSDFEAVVSPILYWSDFNNRESVYLEPGIEQRITKDIYIAPKSLESEREVESFDIKVKEKLNYPKDNSISVTLLGFDRSKVSNNMQAEEVLIGAITEFTYNEFDFSYVDTLYTWLNISDASTRPIVYKVKDKNIHIALNNMMMNEDRSEIAAAEFIHKPADEEWPEFSETFTFEMTIKPFMNLVWAGTLLLVSGFFLSMGKYRKMSKSVEIKTNAFTNGNSNGHHNEISNNVDVEHNFDNKK